MHDWEPSQYLKFKNQRTQPSIDLANRIDIQPPKRILDIGCGPGNSTEILKKRWPDAEVLGLDNSSNMIEEAKTALPHLQFILKDTSDDLSELGEFDVVFSNAALQWMPNHKVLIPKMFSQVSDGGVLAVQVPFAEDLPIYFVIREMIQSPKWRDYFKNPPNGPKHFDFQHFYEIISDLSPALEMWQTEYIHEMDSHEDILEWYKGSGMPPFLAMLQDKETKDEFCLDYFQRIIHHYPIENNGKILLPFPRFFFIVHN